MLPIREIVDITFLDRTDVPSQVTLAERKVLKHLASELDTDGAFVDLGSGAGSAALAIAEGLALRDKPFPEFHAYDWFSLGPDHYATDKFKAISNPNDASFLPDFNHFLAPYLEHIQVHSGDIKKERWTGNPIGLLHVDICKDASIFNHIAREFFSSLIPGAIFVHQDFSRPRLPWLHYSTGIMDSVLEPLGRTGSSVFYRIRQTPPAAMIADMTDDRMALERRKEMVALGIERARSAPHVASEHFTCLAEFTDIYVDYWFNSRKVATERFLSSDKRQMFEKFYPELMPEISA